MKENLIYTIMAFQDGIIKLKGQMGDISFYKSKNGYSARKKGGIDPARLKTDPAFERTRENGAEFGRAGSAVKLLRTALRGQLQTTKDSTMSNRLVRQMIKVLQADATNARGQRTVTAGDLALLAGFEFNDNGKLGGTFFAPFTPVIDRVTGTFTISIPEFISGNMIARPEGATHFNLMMAALDINFQAGTYTVNSSESGVIAIGPQATPATDLTTVVTPQSPNALMLIFGISFFQFVNGAQYPLKNGAFNALAIVSVNPA